MQQSSLIKFISATILVTGVTLIPMTLPAAAQVAVPGTQPGDTTSETRNIDNGGGLWGLWGLSGLFGLLGLVGRRKENTDREMREGTPTYNDPSRR